LIVAETAGSIPNCQGRRLSRRPIPAADAGARDPIDDAVMAIIGFLQGEPEYSLE
jgi:hypothetical protein